MSHESFEGGEDPKEAARRELEKAREAGNETRERMAAAKLRGIEMNVGEGALKAMELLQASRPTEVAEQLRRNEIARGVEQEDRARRARTLDALNLAREQADVAQRARRNPGESGSGQARERS